VNYAKIGQPRLTFGAKPLAVFITIQFIVIAAVIGFHALFPQWVVSWVGIGDTSVPERLIFLRGTVVTQIAKFFTAKQLADSWKPMLDALDYLQSGANTPLYTQVFFTDKIKFQYPLSSLLPLLALKTILPDRTWVLQALNLITWAGLVATIAMSMQIFKTVSQKLDPNLFKNKSESILAAVTLAVLGLIFYPTLKAYGLGQLQVLINCCFAFAFWNWLKGRERMAGVLIGLMALMKPQYVLFLAWGVLRRRWSFTTAILTVIAVGKGLAIAIFGWSNTVDYLPVISFLSRHGEVFYPNQSINGLLNRLLFNGDSLTWMENGFPPFHPLVYGGTVLTSALMLLAALLYPLLTSYRSTIIDFAIIGVTCTVASPVAWEHHYGILLPIYAFVFPLMAIAFSTQQRLLLALCVSYLLAGNFLGVLNNTARVPILNILQSYVLFAVLILLAILYWLGAHCKRQAISLTKF
jgi:alpha-1,2-mannosyltransferase